MAKNGRAQRCVIITDGVFFSSSFIRRGIDGLIIPTCGNIEHSYHRAKQKSTVHTKKLQSRMKYARGKCISLCVCVYVLVCVCVLREREKEREKKKFSEFPAGRACENPGAECWSGAHV